MKMVKLGLIAEIAAGNSAPQNREFYKNGKYNFLRTSDVGQIHVGSISESRDKLNVAGIEGLKLQPVGTILFPKSGASTFLNHRVIMNREAFVSSHLATIKARNEFALDRFLFYFLQTIDARNLCQDQAYPSLNRDQIAGIDIPLPSLPEQKTIVEKLDAAFAEIVELEGNYLAKLKFMKELLAASLNREFTSLGRQFGKESMGNICLKIQDGSHFSPKVQYDSHAPGRYMYLTSKNIRNNFMDMRKVIFVDGSFHREIFTRCNPEYGDVLLTKDGVNTGNVTLNIVREPFSLLSSVCILKPDRQKVEPRYIKYFLQSPGGKQGVLGDMTGTAIKRIILKTIKEIQVPLPPLDVQKVIADKLDSLLEDSDAFFRNLDDLNLKVASLRESVLKDAFYREFYDSE